MITSIKRRICRLRTIAITCIRKGNLMKCKHCGADLPDDANYCDICGEPCVSIWKIIKHEISAIGAWIFLIYVFMVIVFLMFLPVFAVVFFGLVVHGL